MLYTMKDKKDNKVYTLKSMDEVILKDDKDLFVVRLDGAKLHTYDEFVATAKKAFQTPTDENMFWLNPPVNIWICWATELDWLLDTFNSFALIVENWSKALDRDSKEKKENLLRIDLQYTCDYWGYEVLEVRGGSIEPKDFNIYLVD